MSIESKDYHEKIALTKEQIVRLNGHQKRNDHLWWSLISEKMFAIPRYVNRNDKDLPKALIEVAAWLELWVCSKDSF